MEFAPATSVATLDRRHVNPLACDAPATLNSQFDAPTLAWPTAGDHHLQSATNRHPADTTNLSPLISMPGGGAQGYKSVQLINSTGDLHDGSCIVSLSGHEEEEGGG